MSNIERLISQFREQLSLQTDTGLGPIPTSLFSKKGAPRLSVRPTAKFGTRSSTRPCRGTLYHELKCGHLVSTDIVTYCAANCKTIPWIWGLPTEFSDLELDFNCPICLEQQVKARYEKLPDIAAHKRELEERPDPVSFEVFSEWWDKFLIIDGGREEQVRQELQAAGRACELVDHFWYTQGWDRNTHDEDLTEAFEDVWLDWEDATDDCGRPVFKRGLRRGRSASPERSPTRRQHHQYRERSPLRPPRPRYGHRWTDSKSAKETDHSKDATEHNLRACATVSAFGNPSTPGVHRGATNSSSTKAVSDTDAAATSPANGNLDDQNSHKSDSTNNYSPHQATYEPLVLKPRTVTSASTESTDTIHSSGHASQHDVDLDKLVLPPRAEALGRVNGRSMRATKGIRTSARYDEEFLWELGNMKI